jgi:hypothetical protein
MDFLHGTAARIGRRRPVPCRRWPGTCGTAGGRIVGRIGSLWFPNTSAGGDMGPVPMSGDCPGMEKNCHPRDRPRAAFPACRCRGDGRALLPRRAGAFRRFVARCRPPFAGFRQRRAAANATTPKASTPMIPLITRAWCHPYHAPSSSSAWVSMIQSATNTSTTRTRITSRVTRPGAPSREVHLARGIAGAATGRHRRSFIQPRAGRRPYHGGPGRGG